MRGSHLAPHRSVGRGPGDAVGVRGGGCSRTPGGGSGPFPAALRPERRPSAGVWWLRPPDRGRGLRVPIGSRQCLRFGREVGGGGRELLGGAGTPRVGGRRRAGDGSGCPGGPFSGPVGEGKRLVPVPVGPLAVFTCRRPRGAELLGNRGRSQRCLMAAEHSKHFAVSALPVPGPDLSPLGCCVPLPTAQLLPAVGLAPGQGWGCSPTGGGHSAPEH